MPLAPHAEPFLADARPGQDGRRVGVLLSHGFTGSPASMVPWGRFLAEKGYAVAVPRLPGHGTTWQEMNRTTWADWYGELDRAFDKLLANNDSVVVGGLSMGGALALELAADRGREVAGIVLVNPAVNTTRKDVLALPVLKHVVRSFPGIANDIKKGGEEYGYTRTPLKAAHSMMTAWRSVRSDLPKVTQPLLLFRSAEDHTVDPSSAKIILGSVSSRDVTERLLDNSYHVATLDNDAPAIFAESAEFVERVTRS
ncbi:MAG: alpha/beta hydrolase [Nocardioidaceae bacterium]